MKSKSSKSSTASSIVGMSSDVDDDQVLPDSLRKLEIVSVYSACKTNNERHQNPFLTELSTENSADDRVCILVLLLSAISRFQNCRPTRLHAETMKIAYPIWATLYVLVLNCCLFLCICQWILDYERPVWTVMQ